MTLAILFSCLWALLIIGRGTPFGDRLNRLMVELPAERLARLRVGQVSFGLVLLGIAGALVWAGGEDAVRVLGMAMPDAAAWLATVELSVWLDALAVATAALSTMRFGAVRSRAAAVVAALVAKRRPRQPRSRRRSGEPVAGNDDDERWRTLVAA